MTDVKTLPGSIDEGVSLRAPRAARAFELMGRVSDGTGRSVTLRSPRILVGAVLGTVALWATLRGVDVRSLASIIGAVDPAFTAAAVVTTLVSVAILTVRWQLLFGEHRSDVRFGPAFQATVIGQMLNIVTPIRVGEIARFYRIRNDTGVAAGRVLATLAAEKALEVAVFGAAAACVLTFVAVPPAMIAPQLAWAGVPVAAAAALWAIAEIGPAAANYFSRITFLPAGLRRRLVALGDSFVTGLNDIRSPRLAVQALALSVAGTLTAAFSNSLLLLAFDLHLPAWSGLLLLVVLQAGSVPPSLPGRAGVFNYVAVVTLEWLGVDRLTAVSYSLCLYAVAYLPKIALGAVFMVLPIRRGSGAAR